MCRIEFYEGDAEKCTAIIDSDAVPRAGEAISIRKKSYTVTRVTWAVDYPDNPPSNLRACVVLEPIKAKKQR